VADPFDLSALREKADRPSGAEARWPADVDDGADGDDASDPRHDSRRRFIAPGDGIHAQGPVLLTLTLAFFNWDVSVVSPHTHGLREPAAVPIWTYEHDSFAAQGSSERLGQMLSRLDVTGDSAERRESREMRRTGVVCARCFMLPAAPVFANAWCSMRRAEAVAECGGIAQLSAWSLPQTERLSSNVTNAATDATMDSGFDPTFGVTKPQTLRFNDSVRLRPMLPTLPRRLRLSPRGKSRLTEDEDESRAERGNATNGGASRMLSTAARLGIFGLVCGDGG
jgi:hypothetical protein